MQEANKEELGHDLVAIEQEKVKPTNKKMSILNMVIIVTICAGLFIYMITVDGIDNIINVLKSVDYRWVMRWAYMFNASLGLRWSKFKYSFKKTLP